MKYKHTISSLVFLSCLSLCSGYAFAYGVQQPGALNVNGVNDTGKKTPITGNDSNKSSSVNPDSLIINNSNTLKKLSEANAKHALLSAQLGNAELEEQILKIDRKNNLPSNGSGNGGGFNSFRDVRNIKVILLTGFNNNYSATLEFGKKQYLNVHSNSILPNGWVVQSVTSDGVFLKTDKGPMELPFGGEATDNDGKKNNYKYSSGQPLMPSSLTRQQHVNPSSFGGENSVQPVIPSLNGGMMQQHP